MENMNMKFKERCKDSQPVWNSMKHIYRTCGHNVGRLQNI